MELKTLFPGAQEYAELDQRLVAFNRQQVNWDNETFQIVLLSENGDLTGGARGIVRMGAVEIRGLWLDENTRGSGTGVEIIRKLEFEAKKLGAKTALLDTYDFQAREFYEQIGYEVFGTFNYPDGTARHYMSKSIT